MANATNRKRRDNTLPLTKIGILVIGSLLAVGQLSVLHLMHSASLHSDLKNPTWEVIGQLPNSISEPLSESIEAISDPLSESIEDLRRRLLPSAWTLADRNSDPAVATLVAAQLNEAQKSKAMELCGKFLYSSLKRAVQVGDMGEQTFVATGDIDDMWTRDSAVQIGIYVGRMKGEPWLRLIVEGAIRRQAFNIIQDPYANSYEQTWKDPLTLPIKDLVIGRGGWVASRNYELDSGAYFLQQIYDYYVADGSYRPEALLEEPMIFNSVLLMIDTWIVEQNHETLSTYRYFELSNQGKGAPTSYTGMSWAGFRPSDDPCKYGYLIPANIHAAGGLERVLELNKRIWHSSELDQKASKLLKDIEKGIRQFGVVKSKTGEEIYAYEVDGKGNVLSDFDDANVPSLLSIPLLGWTRYDRKIYENTRKRLLSPDDNEYYFKGKLLQGIGSPHTPMKYVWPMAFAIEALTTNGSSEEIANAMAFQIRQSLDSACHDAMHEGVHSDGGCGGGYSRDWFEWANALFVVLVESALGDRCDASGRLDTVTSIIAKNGPKVQHSFYKNPYHNSPLTQNYYQGIEAQVKQ
jgi:meiotically up-regulated gene 157 (Mug157) protein